MSKKLLIEVNPTKYSVYVVRFLCVILMGYFFLKLHNNIVAAVIISTPFFLFIIFSATSNIKVYEDSIMFRYARIIPTMSIEYSYDFIDIKRVELKKTKVNLIIFILPGVGAIKDSRIVFYFFNGTIKEEIIGGQYTDVKKIHQIISSRLKSNTSAPRSYH